MVPLARGAGPDHAEGTTIQHSPARIARSLAALTIVPLLLGSAGTAAAATDTDPSLPDYPRIRSYDLIA